MLDVERITTEYSMDEDRLCMSAQSSAGEVLVLWLTQRLVHRLVPHLCRWLEQHDSGDSQIPEALQSVRNIFAQQAAQVALQQHAQQPVKAVPKASKELLASVLVNAVELTTAKERATTLTLTFKGVEGKPCARLPMPALALRQWLGILQGQCRQADWHLQKWPLWLQESATVLAAPSARQQLH